MIVARILILLSLLIIVGCYGAFLITKDRRYLKFMGQLFRFGLFFLVIAALLFILERLILI